MTSEIKRLAALRNCLSESLLDIAHSSKSSADNINISDEIGTGTTSERLLSENHMISLKDSREYHATLLAFEKQGFPSDILNESDEDDEGRSNGINLTWRGAYSLMPPKSQQEVHHSLIWDRVCSMWNIASLELQLASIQDLSSKSGCKIAISNCQSSSTVLNVLRDIIQTTSGNDNTTYTTIDLSKSMLNFWESIIIASGQVCIYKMANLNEDGDPPRQHTTLAYLCNGVVQLYNESLKYSQDPRLVSELPTESKIWSIHCKIYSMIFTTRLNFHLSIHNRINSNWGVELYYLKQSLKYIKECIDFCKTNSGTIGSSGKGHGSISKAVVTECETLYKLINTRLHKANDDNLNIYQEKIPLEIDNEDVPSKILMKRNQQTLPDPMLYSQVKLFQNI